MTDFVRDDVRLREVARRAEAAIELHEEAGIEVNLLIARTIERSDGRGADPARGIDCVREANERGLAIGAAGLAEDLPPGNLGVAEHAPDHFAGLIGWCPARARLRRALLHVAAGVQESQRIARDAVPEHEKQDQSAQS